MVQIPRLPTSLTATMDRNTLVDLLIGHQESIYLDENVPTTKSKKSSGLFSRLTRRWRGVKKQKPEHERYTYTFTHIYI